jgi:hypothetical protein
LRIFKPNDAWQQWKNTTQRRETMKKSMFHRSAGNLKRGRLVIRLLVCCVWLLLIPTHAANAATNDPDLVITSLRTTGMVASPDPNYVIMRAEITVKNQCPSTYCSVLLGHKAAPKFKISVDYTGPNGLFGAIETTQVSFQTDRDPNYGWIDSLAPGNSQTVAGALWLPVKSRYNRVTLTGLADSCRGDEFMPAYCRVYERFETNNTLSTMVLVP